MTAARLYIFSGLPGTGKSSLSRALAQYLGATHLRIDVIEQGLRDICGIEVIDQGYRLAYEIAEDNLKLGQPVIADSCNPIAITRKDWQQVAERAAVPYLNIEIICSDPDEHRRRIETRDVGIANLKLPSWQDVLDRDYEPWDDSADHFIRLDTAGISEQDAVQKLLATVGDKIRPGQQ